MWQARLVSMLKRAKRKSSRSSRVTAKCVTRPFWERSKQMTCRTHKMYVRECAVRAASYHAKYLRSPGYCSQACRKRASRKAKLIRS